MEDFLTMLPGIIIIIGFSLSLIKNKTQKQ